MPLRVVCVLLLAFLSAEPRTHAQSLAAGLFDRYIDPLRLQAGIPGMAGIIVQNGRTVWEGAFGLADVDRVIAVQPDTPFFIADMSQTLGATLLMQRVERGDFSLDDRVARWTTRVPAAGATVQNVLTHTSTGSYNYAPGNFSALTDVIEFYTKEPYRLTVAREVLTFLAMRSSAPGHDLESPNDFMRLLFEPGELERYQAVIRRMAVPYRVDGRGRPVRSELPAQGMDAATGLVTTVRDLKSFDAALDQGNLLDADTVAFMVGGARPGTPAGLGWFVQAYRGERIVWHFGLARGAYSSLFLKVPSRGLTFILLANSDGLSAPFALERGDVTTSLFAKLFLTMFVG